MHSIKLIHIAVLISLSGLGGLYAQSVSTKDSTKTIRYSIFNEFYSNGYYKSSTALNFAVRIGEKSTLYAGPTFLYDTRVINDQVHYAFDNRDSVFKSTRNTLYEYDTLYNRSTLQNINVNAGYRYMLSKAKNHRRFQFYLESNMSYYSYRLRHRAALGDIGSLRILSSSTGYTMKVRLVGGLHVYNHIGLGPAFVFRKYNNEAYTRTEVKFYVRALSVGLGYDF